MRWRLSWVRLSGPVLLLIGAVAALGAAWYYNWFNMREIVANAAAVMQEKWGELTPLPDRKVG